jgi:hypothetical protein
MTVSSLIYNNRVFMDLCIDEEIKLQERTNNLRKKENRRRKQKEGGENIVKIMGSFALIHWHCSNEERKYL